MHWFQVIPQRSGMPRSLSRTPPEIFLKSFVLSATLFHFRADLQQKALVLQFRHTRTAGGNLEAAP